MSSHQSSPPRSSGEKHLLPSEIKTVGDAVRFATSRLAVTDAFFGHGTATAADEAHALVMQCLHLGFDVAPYVYAAALTAAEKVKLANWLERRIERREPLPYIVGEAWFTGLAFHVDPRVLIPRSPIGELIETRFDPWLALPDNARILDMCTGSACIAIACAVWLPDVTVHAVDNDADALAVAQTNVARHGVEERVELIHSDVFTAVESEAPYDLIIANPPYVPEVSMQTLPAEYAHEPRHALHADDDGLALAQRILRDAPRYLADDGVLMMEVGESAAALDAACAHLPFVWCEFERGGDGVLVIDKAGLAA
ncbi:MAG: 50S ribosomal protein L3 N(5)-glutamine methyltransferase [Gammaproteobacteria bacterium]